MNEQSESLSERNDRIRKIEFVESLIRYEKLLNKMLENNNLIWDDAVDYLKRRGLYHEFATDTTLENYLKEALEDGRDLGEGIVRKRERVLVNYFIENLDKEAKKLNSEDEEALFYRNVLDDLCNQRLPGKLIDDIYVAPVDDDVLEGKITLLSMRYYKLVGARPR